MDARIETSGDWAGTIEISVNGEVEYSTTSKHDKNITFNRQLEKNDTFTVKSKDVDGNLNIEIKVKD